MQEKNVTKTKKVDCRLKLAFNRLIDGYFPYIYL